MSHIGIVGSEAAKFTAVTEAAARALIAQLLRADPDAICVSGGCHLGGIDIWAEDIAESLNVPTHTFRPASLNWEHGYKPRNIAIAEVSDVVHCITLRELPASYTGMRFAGCYHCRTTSHVKSGGCWTAKYAERQLGKASNLHIIAPDGIVESSW